MNVVEIEKSKESPWREYRRRRILFFLVFASYLPCVFMLEILFQKLFQTQEFIASIPLLYMVAFGVAAWRFVKFPCPKCGKPFMHRYPYPGNMLTKICMHCGHKKWEDFSAEK